MALADPRLWEAQKRMLGAVAIIAVVESALILALVRMGNRRREAQQRLEAQLRFERRLSNLAVSIATSTPDALDATLDGALRHIADEIGADAVWCWPFGEEGDDWSSPPLRAAQQAEFTDVASLPRGIRRRLPATPGLAVSCLAVPLVTGGAVSGAMFWISYGGMVTWDAHADKLRVVGAVVAAVLQGKRAEAALEQSDRLKGAILDSLPAHVAVLDRDGFIIAVNQAWTEVAHAGGVPAGRAIETASNYVSACIDAAGAGVPGADEALMLIKLACRGGRSDRHVEYQSRVDGRERWFLMTAEPLRRVDGGAVVTHSDITGRKLNEIALRESEYRFRTAEQMLRDLNHRLIVAQEDERRHIARELHDHLSQQLALLAIDLQQLSLEPPAARPELVAALHEEWRRTAEIASDVHAISHRLHPSKLESLGLVATVRAHCRDVSRKGLNVHFSDENMPVGIPPDTALCLFRVAEEALTNASRHSGASEAFVTLVGTESDVILRVVDDGSGFEPAEADEGLGLVSMRERVQALVGTFSITSLPGKGTVVEARVRCPGRPAARLSAESA